MTKKIALMVLMLAQTSAFAAPCQSVTECLKNIKNVSEQFDYALAQRNRLALDLFGVDTMHAKTTLQMIKEGLDEARSSGMPADQIQETLDNVKKELCEMNIADLLAVTRFLTRSKVKGKQADAQKLVRSDDFLFSLRPFAAYCKVTSFVVISNDDRAKYAGNFEALYEYSRANSKKEMKRIEALMELIIDK